MATSKAAEDEEGDGGRFLVFDEFILGLDVVVVAAAAILALVVVGEGAEGEGDCAGVLGAILLLDSQLTAIFFCLPFVQLFFFEIFG